MEEQVRGRLAALDVFCTEDVSLEALAMRTSRSKHSTTPIWRRIRRPFAFALFALVLVTGTATLTYWLAVAPQAPADLVTTRTAAGSSSHAAANTDGLTGSTPATPSKSPSKSPEGSPAALSTLSTSSTHWGADGAVGEDGGPDAAADTSVPQTRSDAPEGACTAGVSACAFENGIDFTEVSRAVAGAMRQDFRSDAITCDLGQVAPNRAQVGAVLACGVQGQERISPTVAVKVTATGSHFRLVGQPTVLEKYRGDCTRVVTAAFRQADQSGDAALLELGRQYGRSTDLYSLAYDRLYGTEGDDPHLVCESPGPSTGLDPYPGSPLKYGDTDPGGFSGLSAISDVQQSLLDQGYDIIPNGRFDRVTERAVKQFQSAHGLAADGVVGPVTWRWLIG